MKILKYILLLSLLFNVSDIYSKSNDNDIRYLIKNHKYKQALSLLEKSSFETMEYYKYKGIIYYGMYKPDSTIFYLKKFYQKNKKDDEVLIKLSQAFLWKKNMKAASPVLKKVSDKNNLEYLKVLAFKYELLGEYNKANKLYDRVIEKEKLPYGTMERKAILLSWMKQYDASIKLLDEIIDTKIVSKSLRIRCLLKKAEVLGWKMKFDDAVTVLNQALKIDSNNKQAKALKKHILSEKNDDFLIKTAEQLLWKKNYKDASPLLEQVRDKNNLDYLKVLAIKYELLKEYDKAIALYDKILKRKKYQYDIMERKAILLSWMKRYDSSIDLLNKIIKSKRVEKSVKIRCKINKAEILSWKKEFKRAINILDALLKKEPKNIPARFVKSQILEWMGEFKAAKDVYKEVLLIDNNNKKAKRKLEKLLWVD